MLAEDGLKQVENSRDGNCLFEALSLLIFATDQTREKVRSEVYIVSFIATNQSLFVDQISEVQRQRRRDSGVAKGGSEGPGTLQNFGAWSQSSSRRSFTL